MRMSLFLNSTMSKTCVRPQTKGWVQQDKKSCVFSQDSRRTFYHQASSSKQSGLLSPETRHIRQLPDVLSVCHELQWFLHSRTSLSQTLDTAIKQICSLSALLLLYLTLLLLSAQVAGLVLLLACAVSLPLGFQFMIAAVFVISATAFRIMY